MTQPRARSYRRIRRPALALALAALLTGPLLLAPTASAHLSIPAPIPASEEVVDALPLGSGGVIPTAGGGLLNEPVHPLEPADEGPSIQYRHAMEHAGDALNFEFGGRVTVPFTPRLDDTWEVDGSVPVPLPPGHATGEQMLRAAPGLAWASGVPSDVAQPGRFGGFGAGGVAAGVLGVGRLGAVRGDDPLGIERAAPVGGPTLASVAVRPTPEVRSTARVGANGLRREVFGFLPYWELSDPSTVLDWRTLSTVAYFSVGCTSTGALLKRNLDGSPTTGWAGWTSSKMTSIINAAHQHQTRVVLTVTCFGWSTAGATAQARLLGSSTARATLARQVAAAVRDRGADGVNLDFEPIVAGYGDEFTRLVRTIRAELNAIAPGYQLTFDAFGSIDNQPIVEATAPGGADAVFVMGYDYRTASANVAGSIAPLSGPMYDLTDTVQAYTARISPSKVILGVPYYGRAWSTPTDDLHAKNISGSRYGRASEPPYALAATLVAAHGRRYDSVEQAPWTAYRKQTCTAAYGCVTSWRQLYYDDAASLKLRYDLVNRASLRGAGIWALGFDNARPELRAALAAKFLADRTPPVTGIVTMPSRQRDEGFRVAWTAYDDSAIRSYDVQVSVNGGWWSSWLSGTTRTSAIYLGTDGRTYAFRVRATDAHGNVSAWTALPLGSLGTPSGIAVGGFATVVMDGLRLRASPSIGASVMTRFRVGTALRVIGGPVTRDGYAWYQVAGPVRQWGPVDAMQVGGWVAARGNGVTNAAPRSPVYATRVDAGITGLRLNRGGARVLTPNGDGSSDALHIEWRNERAFGAMALRVFRANGTLAGEVAFGRGKLTAGAHTFDWDGRLRGTRVPAGVYVIQVRGVAGGATYTAPSVSPVSASQIARYGAVVGSLAPTSVRFRTSPASPTRARTITYTLTFGGPVTDLAANDFTRSGTATGCSLGRPTGSGASWSLAATGCSAGTLVLSLRAAAVIDAVSNRGPASRAVAPTVIIDRTAPTNGAPKAQLAAGITLPSAAASAGIPVTLTWAARDRGGAGIASHDIRVSRDGGAFADLATGLPSASLRLPLVPGHTYRFAVRSRDRAGNLNGWTAGSTFRALLVQQDNAAIRYGGTWHVSENRLYSAGAVRSTTVAGAAASITFTGRGIAWVAIRGSDRGTVRIYIDGALVAMVSTYAASPGYRFIAWSRTWATSGTHTLRLVALGTAGHPGVDLDAFEILR